MTGRVSRLSTPCGRPETCQKNVWPAMVSPEKIYRRVPDFRNPGCNNLKRGMLHLGFVPKSLTASSRVALTDGHGGKRDGIANRHLCRGASGALISDLDFHHPC